MLVDQAALISSPREVGELRAERQAKRLECRVRYRLVDPNRARHNAKRLPGKFRICRVLFVAGTVPVEPGRVAIDDPSFNDPSRVGWLHLRDIENRCVDLAIPLVALDEHLHPELLKLKVWTLLDALQRKGL